MVAVVYAVTVALACLLPGTPSVNAGFAGVDKLIHLLLWTGLGLLTLRATARGGAAGVALAWGLASGYGLVLEGGQYFVDGRSTSMGDALANLLGAALGVAIGTWWEMRHDEAATTP